MSTASSSVSARVGSTGTTSVPSGFRTMSMANVDTRRAHRGTGDSLREVVGPSGFEARPLGDGASVDPSVVAVDDPLLRPAGRRVLPRLLASVDGEVHERV